MKISYIFILVLLFIRCDNTIDNGPSPCAFAPSESKFTILPLADCDSCYFKIQFMGKEYSFAGNQIQTLPGITNWGLYKVNLSWESSNDFFKFHFISPSTVELLNSSKGIKTPLLKVDTLSKLKYYVPSPVSVSFGISNYCKEFFEPIRNVGQSYHKLTNTELFQSYPIGTINGDTQNYQQTFIYCYGEINATFIINGKTQLVTAQYKLLEVIWEKI